MKRFFRRTIIYCLFTFLVLSMPAILKAQGGPGGPGDPACDPQCNCYPDPPYAPCPIDDGLYLLIFIGLGYGIKKYRDAAMVKAKNGS